MAEGFLELGWHVAGCGRGQGGDGYFFRRVDVVDADARARAKLKQIDLVGPLTWTSSTNGKTMTKPKAECILHFFNHQTHHRGQIHAMFTAAGHKPQSTDLVLMPE